MDVHRITCVFACRCEGTLKPLNQKFARYSNHPCQYLGDPDYGPVDDAGGLGAYSTAAVGAQSGQYARVQDRQQEVHNMQRQEQQPNRAGLASLGV